MATQKSAAKQMQEATEAPSEGERKIRVCLRTDVGHEHNMVMVESVVRDLLNPDIPDIFIEVPPPEDVPSVKHKYLHTSRVKELDIFDELTPGDTGVAALVPPPRVDMKLIG